MKYLFSFLTILLSCFNLHAQVTITFTPAVHGQTLEGITNIQVMNTSGSSMRGSLRISVNDGMGVNIVAINAPAVTLRPGVNTFNRAVLSNSNIRFGEGDQTALLGQTGRFAEGEYEYCYEFTVTPFKEGAAPAVFENCFQHHIQPATPLLLIDPYDEAEICNTRPPFSWQPPMPVSMDMRYRIVVAAVNDKQDPAEALANNRPVINVGNLRQTNLVYPVQVPDLKKEQKYAWQVFAHTGTTVVTQSEIWTFTIHCEDSITTDPENSYRELKPTSDVNFYIASGALRFSFHNDYKGGILDYDIIDLANPEQPVKRLPRLKMTTGLNKINLPLANNSTFKDGNQYLLRVKNVGQQELILRFVYQRN